MKLPLFALVIILGSLFFSNGIIGQVPMNVLDRNQMVQDIFFAHEKIKKYHPDLTAFESVENLNYFVEALVSEVPDSLDEFKFRAMLNRYPNYLGCGHTSFRPRAQKVDIKLNYFPLPVFLEGKQLYVRSGKYAGALIKSINEAPGHVVARTIRKSIPKDAVHESFANYRLQKYFQVYQFLRLGGKDTFDLELIKENESINISISSSSILFKSQNLILSKLGQTNKVAVLEMPSVGFKKNKKTLKQLFAVIADSKMETLIVDLRNNGGGNFMHGCHFLQHILDEKFEFVFHRKIGKLDFKKNSSWGWPHRLTRFAFSTIPNKSKKDGSKYYKLKFRPKKKNNFNGKLYVITDGGTFSMASYIASHLKHKSGATVVGAETGGADRGSNALLSPRIELPNSKIRLQLPLYHIQHDVEQPSANGVLPDQIITYTIEDYLQKKELEMEYIIELEKIN